ncbi:MAG: carboxymuconolactone decarboxylase family protein [Magnetococcales bacterium]|nr:carboxymuconolactone decarboxylase family protein [Magnetococcales bacterium]
MSHIDTDAHYPYRHYIRPLLFLLRRKTGHLTDPVKLWGRIPSAFLGFLWTLGSLERRASPLNAQLRALLRTRVSQLDLCAFCIGLNGGKALERGVTEEKLLALADFATSPLYDEAERVALRYTEAITMTGGKVESGLMDALKCHYSDNEIIELAALVAHQNLSTRFNRALGVKE